MIDSEEAVLDLERRRCNAINAGDLAALRSLLTEDYLHVHTSGRIDDLTTYLGVVGQHPRHTERGSIIVRQYGDVAVLIGDQVNVLETRKMVVVVQQVAVRMEDGWRFVAAQVTNKVAPSA